MARFFVSVRFLVIGLMAFDKVICRPSIQENCDCYRTPDLTSPGSQDLKHIAIVHDAPETNSGESKGGSSIRSFHGQLTEEEQQILEHYMPLFSTLLRIDILKNIQHEFNKTNNSDLDETEEKEIDEELWNELFLLLHSIWPHRNPMIVQDTNKLNNINQRNANFKNKITNFLKDLLQTKKTTGRKDNQILPNYGSIGKDTVILKIQSMLKNNKKILNEMKVRSIYKTDKSAKTVANEERRNIEHAEDIPNKNSDKDIRKSLVPEELNGKLIAMVTAPETIVKPGILQNVNDLIPETINNQKIKLGTATDSLKHSSAENIKRDPKQDSQRSLVYQQILEQIASRPHLHLDNAEILSRNLNLDQKEKTNKTMSVEYTVNKTNHKINKDVRPHESERDEKILLVSRSVADNVQSPTEKQPLISNHQTAPNFEDNIQGVAYKLKPEGNIEDSISSSHKPKTTSTRNVLIPSKDGGVVQDEVVRTESACLKFLSLLLKRMAQDRRYEMERLS